MKKEEMLIARTAAQMLANTITTRAGMFKDLYMGQHDISRACGYPDSVDIKDLKKKYKRNGLARRIVDLMPQECWKTLPSIQENKDPEEDTVFEQAWSALASNPKIQLFSNLTRLDKLAGIGRYGILLLGFEGGEPLDKPVVFSSGKGLAYMRPFDESLIRILEVETDTSNERYGLPIKYEIDLGTPVKGSLTAKIEVHWSRVIHLADNLTDNLTYGIPRLEPVYNQILDIEKVLGGSAEMYWRGAFPGISFEADAETVIGPDDEAAMKEQIDYYVESLSRYLTLQGVKANVLAPAVASPSDQIKAAMEFIAVSIGVPLRILIGSEQAQLASEQDRSNFADRIKGRRENYLTPILMQPFIQRLIDVGTLPLPTEDPFIMWPDLYSPSERDKAETAKSLTEAVAKYASVPMAQDVLPLQFFLKLILGWDKEQVEAILEEVEIQKKEEYDESLEEEEEMEIE